MFTDLVASRFAPRLPTWLLAAFGLAPRPIGLRTRVASFPTQDLPTARPVSVRWNQHHVPYVEAQTDDDLAFAVGLVHGHLRGHQIALMRIVAQGRVSELAGPPGREIDHALRTLGFTRPVAAIERRLPADTRRWLERFVQGLNHHQSLGLPRPPELRLLKLPFEPWTVGDVLSVGRLLGADFTWLTFLALLPARRKPGFADLWRRILESGCGPTVEGAARDPMLELARTALSSARAGSNAVVVAPRRSASGGPLIACDPHLGLSLPNIWLLMGLRSPSYRVVGLMLAGLPFVCIGRNPELAWGGTNLRAASTDLYDVSALPPREIRTETIAVRTRWARTVHRRVRYTPFGPILSDARLLGIDPSAPVALRWMGHEATDEVTPFLRAARARTGAEFKAAFGSYAVPAQTMLFADCGGNIGRVTAATLPERPPFGEEDFVRDAGAPGAAWESFVGSAGLPSVANPPEGFIVSANDRLASAAVPIGFLFDYGDRAAQLRTLLRRAERLTPTDLAAAFDDASSPAAARLARRLARELAGLARGHGQCSFVRRLSAWDGSYAVSSSGAVAFEVLLAHLVPLICRTNDAPALDHSIAQWNFIAHYLEHELDLVEPGRRGALLRRALRRAARDAARHASWGDMHRVRVAHILADLPLIGSAFVLEDLPSPGSRQTPYKTTHGLVRGRHHSKFGAMARFVADLADLDSNHFVLFGGQDEQLGSTTSADQVTLWREGRTIRMPLRPATVAAEFPILTLLQPSAETAEPDATPGVAEPLAAAGTA